MNKPLRYPNGQMPLQTSQKQSAARRGMTLEHDLNQSNQYYLDHDLAVIYKKPTPIQVVKVDYAARNKTKIIEAYYQTPSTIDYSGVYKGYHLDFEAKETHSKTSFPFRSIHPHQIDYIEKVLKHGAISFVIVRFVFYDKTYLVEGDKMVNVYRQRERSSIPYSWFEENAYLVPSSFYPSLDYLKIVDLILPKEVNQ